MATITATPSGLTSNLGMRKFKNNIATVLLYIKQS